MRRSGLSESRYEIIPNGIDLEKFTAVPAARRKLRAEWSVGDEELLIAFTGRLHPDKGPDTLLEAFKQLAETNASIKLVIAGNGPMEDELEKFITENGLSEKVFMLGHVGNVPEILADHSAASSSRIKTVASKSENSSAAPKEADPVRATARSPTIPGNRLLNIGSTALFVSISAASICS